jgi:hypothetical protein
MENEARMKAFATTERNKRRSDRFTLADFTLDLEQEDPRFYLYCERFGVGREVL